MPHAVLSDHHTEPADPHARPHTGTAAGPEADPGADPHARPHTGASVRRRPALADEQGAQAAEYAMLGGVSAAACGALIAILKNPSTLERVVDAVVGALTRLVGSWF